ncbi:Peptidylarginine deiminase and related enzyme [Hahella chejuensis KCTC 2396]|uniref:Peptidylarginine deiminase and related enzyme n=1 Tax=Hahella chejuensis (strain KCTC 2396) TaxID=349521 RepID=Q2SJK4_HAHCH|nr:agmatine deiminase family protein [Hahella chejuensis]ABC29170.1 Peptidylarginine deiminase and related enzyme [Hahella chejuensis KCTC 2396]
MSTIVLPPEWAPQCAVLLTWPHEQTDWADRLEEVDRTFLEIAIAVCKYQNLVINCQSFPRLEAIADALHENGVPPEKVALFCAPSNDTWSRDHGPITIYDNEEPVLLDFHFNAWGGKFDSEKDDQITATLYELGAFDGAALRHIPYILEGGSIETDGRGTLLTTSACLLTPTRNPDATKEKVEAVMAEHLGVKRTLWLDHGYLAGDDTDSHIDTLARFCDERTICYVQCLDTEDEHYAELSAMEKQLQSFVDADGAPYKLVPLPMASAAYDEDGQRLPATYANFLIINEAVLVPVYGVPEDQAALDAIQSCFPDRNIEAIDCRSLIEQHGSLHCVTMQLPEGVI